MKLEFSWRKRFDALEPDCTSDGPNLLCNLLTDTGGLKYLSTVDWLEEGLRCVRAIRSHEDASLDWGREDWGATLRADGVTLFSVHEPDDSEVITLDAFETALRAWIDFIQTEPGGPNKVIDL